MSTFVLPSQRQQCAGWSKFIWLHAVHASADELCAACAVQARKLGDVWLGAMARRMKRMRKMTTFSLVAAILLLPWLISRVLSMLLSLYLIGVLLLHSYSLVHSCSLHIGFWCACDTVSAFLVDSCVCKPVCGACIVVCMAEHHCIQAAQSTWTQL